MRKKHPYPKKGSHEERALAYWLNIGVVSAYTSRLLQKELWEILIPSEEHRKVFSEFYSKTPEEFDKSVKEFQNMLPLMDPLFIMFRIAGEQAQAIETLLKVSLIRNGKEIREVYGHVLTRHWGDFQKTSPEEYKACNADFGERLKVLRREKYDDINEKVYKCRSIPILLKRHNQDLMKFRYGQDNKDKEMGEIPTDISVIDRIPLFLFIQTLERIIVMEKEPLSSNDKKEIEKLKQSLKTHFHHGMVNERKGKIYLPYTNFLRGV